jgi:xylulokinase
MTLLLGIDVGTTSVKAAVYDVAGTRLAGAGREYRLHHPAPDRVEIDPATWWEAAVAAVREALATPGVAAGAVAAIGVSSQGESVTAVDAAGRPLAPALVWLDNRAMAEARELAAAFPPDVVYERTGVPDINPTWTGAKLLWLRRHEPALFAKAARFLLAEDVLVHRLTGELVTDGGIQCTTLLFDIRDGGWWPAMLDAVGVRAEQLPRIIPTGSVAGALTTAAAGALGLRAGLPVVAGGMDQGAGAIGVGNTSAGIVSESTGGALTVQATTGDPGSDPTRQTPVYVHSAPGRWLYCPVCPTGGMALTWFRDQLGGAEVHGARDQSEDGYAALTALAEAVPPGCEGLTMLPHLAGAFSPEYVPSARGVFAGFTLAHTRGHFVRAVLEAVAFMLRRNLELLDAAGAPAREIRSHGGGARSELWNRIKADACDRPVVTLDGEDAAVRGDAMLAGVAVGAWRGLEEAARAMVAVRARYEPDPRNRVAYDDAYARYIRLFDALRPEFERSTGQDDATHRGGLQ